MINGKIKKLIHIATFLHPRTVIVFATLAIFSRAGAQVKFSTVLSSSSIGRGEYVQVEYVIENAKQIDELNPPVFSDFHITEGPIQSSGMSVVNGNMSQYKAVSFVLQPVKTGKFSIPGASARIDGKWMHSKAVTLEVNAAGPAGSTGPAIVLPAWPEGSPPDIDREYVLRPGENVADIINRNLFVKIQLSKTSCYVGEPIVATYKLYSRLESESQVTKHPSLNGFSVYDMVEPGRDQPTVEKLNGKSFRVHVIRKAQLVPLQSGTIALDPVEIQNKVHFVRVEKQNRRVRGNSLQDFFDQLSGSEQQGVPLEQNITLESKPVSIEVKPLPEAGKPVSFAGAVGQYSITSEVDNKSLFRDDASVLRVTVKGAGNLPIVNAPGVHWPDGLESYGLAEKDEIDKTVFPLGGSKTFNYTFVPKRDGRFQIPAIDFSFFNPETRSYKTLQTVPVDMDVSTAKKKVAAPGQMLSTSVRMNRAASGGLQYLQEHLGWFFTALILGGIGVFFWTQQRYRTARKSVMIAAATPGGQTTQATEPVPPVAEADPLAGCRRSMQEGDHHGFYQELNRSLWGALEAKINLPSSRLSKEEVTRRLLLMGWQPQHIAQLQDVLHCCEERLYTPGNINGDMERILADAQQVIAALSNA